MKTTNELDLQHYVDLARREVGKAHELNPNGQCEILSYEEVDPHFTFGVNKDIPTGAELGYFDIKIDDHLVRCRVSAYVQTKFADGPTDELYIDNIDDITGKDLDFSFPVLN